MKESEAASEITSADSAEAIRLAALADEPPLAPTEAVDDAAAALVAVLVTVPLFVEDTAGCDIVCCPEGPGTEAESNETGRDSRVPVCCC